MQSKMRIKEEHVIAALEGYLKAMSIIDDDEVIVSVKRNRNNEFEIETESD